MSAPVIVLAAVEAAAAKATPGPWVAFPSSHRWHGSKPIFDTGLWAVLPADDTERLPIAMVDHADDHHEPTRGHAEDDAVFIATASPATVAALCAAIREMHASLEEIAFRCIAAEGDGSHRGAAFILAVTGVKALAKAGIVLDPREPAAGETP